MYKIMKLNKIAAEGLSLFPLDQYEIGTEMASPDAVNASVRRTRSSGFAKPSVNSEEPARS